jgi:hypothetical protein
MPESLFAGRKPNSFGAEILSKTIFGGLASMMTPDPAPERDGRGTSLGVGSAPIASQPMVGRSSDRGIGF